ncbi:guanylate kinase [Thermoflexibacter ruber]|uniref:Guanylate kinase n=1 Tax=Thermoflexibacter ruber TaxID=1003 RepID=A0A1I2HW80_9BACT|nr:guanylate kinase [Thermoflexibacter ruber]SFF34415.1 guanylate kinase [Thermoflexibacter ruber]
MDNTKLIIFSAPSGAGKTTIVRHLLANNPELAFSVSATTRERRSYEVDGKDYYFLSKEEFEEKIKNNEFAEYEQVYQGTYYGTLKSEIERLRKEGKNLIFDVDVEGGLKIKKLYQQDALAIFVKVSSVEVLKERLNNRNTETEAKRAERIAKAVKELMYEKLFDVVIENDNLEEALTKAQKLYNDFKNNTL